jgi:hypothetical protein
VKLSKQTMAILVAMQTLAMLLALAFTLSASQAPSTPVKQLVPDNRAEHPAPVQPIPYSHNKHLALGLQCETCHTNSDPGNLMTFPATSTCMTCHATVAKDKPAIKQLAEYATSGKPISWARVYVVTPGVTWTHRPHRQAGLKCGNCHGPVAQMDTMSQTTAVTSMAVCIDCHTQNKAPTACQTCHAWPVIAPEIKR